MSIQIKKKFLRSQSVDGSKVLFLNEDSFKAKKYDGSEVELFKVTSANEFRLLEIPKVAYDPSADDDLARKKYVDDSIDVEMAAREAADEYLQGEIDSEKAARIAADSAEEAARIAGDLAEASARAAADSAEQAARIAADSAEQAARIAGDLAEATERTEQDRLIRLEFAAADALALLEAKEYTDAEVLKEKERAEDEEESIRFDFAAADLLEKTQREAADQLLRDDLDFEITKRASEDVRVLSESKAYTDVEKARAMAAESAEATTRASEDVRVLSEAKTYTDLEKNRAMAAEALEAATRASEDARVLSESKAYTDMSISAVIDSAPEAYNTLREIAEYISSDQSATTQILAQLYDHETRLDVIEGSGEGSISKAEADAKAYTDEEKVRAMAREAELQSEIDAEEVLRASEDARVLSESKVYTDSEKARAMAREAELQSEIDAEELLRASEDARVLSQAKSYTDEEKVRAMAAEAAESTLRASEDVRVLSESKAYTDLEKARAMAAEAAIRSEFAAADFEIRSDLEDLDGYAQDIRDDLDQEIQDRISDVNAEEARAMAAEAAETAARIAADLAESTLRASEDVRVLSESKSYTDQKVAAVVDSAPEMLDTLRELAQALGNDQNFATSVTGYIATAKQESKDYSKDLVDNLGSRFAKDSFTVDSMVIENGYVELSYKAFQDSIVFTIDRLMLLEQEDYSVSIVGGKTRLTFIGSILQGQEEALASGDKLRVRYLKDVRP